MTMPEEVQKIYDKYSIEDIEYQETALSKLESEVKVGWLSCSVEDFKEHHATGLTSSEKETLLKDMQHNVRILK